LFFDIGGILHYASGGSIPAITSSRRKRSPASLQEYVTKVASKILQFNPTSKTLEETEDKVEKQICLLDSQYVLSGANNSLAGVQNIRKIKTGFKILRGLLDEYLNVMKTSSLDFSLESSHDAKRFPVFFSTLQELSMKITSNTGTTRETEFSIDLIKKMNDLSKLIARETFNLRAGFIHFPDATCQIGPTKLLQCLCQTDVDPYYRIDLSPSFKGGKILSFKNFIFKNSDYKKNDLKTCYYESENDYFLLNEECCTALQKNSKTAIDVCPTIEVKNYSPVKISNGILLIDDSFRHISTVCDSSSSEIVKSADIMRLSSCDSKIIGENTLTYQVEQNGNFNADYVLNNSLETIMDLTVKDIILYLVCSLLGLILLLLIFVLICCFRKNPNGLNCFRRQNAPDISPIQPLGNFEMAEIQALRPIVTVQRSRNTRSIK
jgi:hypothetical protein